MGNTDVQKTRPDDPIRIVFNSLFWGGRVEKALESWGQGLLSLNSSEIFSLTSPQAAYWILKVKILDV